jgi:hypothetical protein
MQFFFTNDVNILTEKLIILNFMYLYFSWRLEVCIGRLYLQKIRYTQPLGLIIQGTVFVHS